MWWVGIFIYSPSSSTLVKDRRKVKLWFMKYNFKTYDQVWSKKCALMIMVLSGFRPIKLKFEFFIPDPCQLSNPACVLLRPPLFRRWVTCRIQALSASAKQKGLATPPIARLYEHDSYIQKHRCGKTWRRKYTSRWTFSINRTDKGFMYGHVILDFTTKLHVFIYHTRFHFLVKSN